MKKDRASLIIHQKLTSRKGLIRELSIWKTNRSERYPEGVKYRLVLVDPITSWVLLLYDNHWPKGHHVHVGEREEPFNFTTIPDLIRIFRERSDREEMRHYEDQKN